MVSMLREAGVSKRLSCGCVVDGYVLDPCLQHEAEKGFSGMRVGFDNLDPEAKWGHGCDGCDLEWNDQKWIYRRPFQVRPGLVYDLCKRCWLKAWEAGAHIGITGEPTAPNSEE